MPNIDYQNGFAAGMATNGIVSTGSSEIVEQIQADWLQTDETQPDFIKNKPEIPEFEQVQGDWNQTDETQPDFIKNKPNISGGTQVQANWDQDDNTAADYIKNKPFGETITFEKEIINVNIAEHTNADGYYTEDEDIVIEPITLSNLATYDIFINDTCYNNLKLIEIKKDSDTSHFDYYGFGNKYLWGLRQGYDSDVTDTGENFCIYFSIDYNELKFIARDNSIYKDGNVNLRIICKLDETKIESDGPIEVESNSFDCDFSFLDLAQLGSNTVVTINVGDHKFTGLAHGVLYNGYPCNWIGNIAIHPYYEEFKSEIPGIESEISDENFITFMSWFGSGGNLYQELEFYTAKDIEDGEYTASISLDSFIEINKIDSKFINLPITPKTVPAGNIDTSDGIADRALAIGETSFAGECAIAVGPNAIAYGNYEDGGAVAVGINAFADGSTSIGHNAIAVDNGIAITASYYEYDTQGVGDIDQCTFDYAIKDGNLVLDFYANSYDSEPDKILKERIQFGYDDLSILISKEYVIGEEASYVLNLYGTDYLPTRRYSGYHGVEIDEHSKKFIFEDFCWADDVTETGKATVIFNYCSEGILIGNGFSDGSVAIKGNAYRYGSVAIDGIAYGRSSVAISGVAGGSYEGTDHTNALAIKGDAYGEDSTAIRGKVYYRDNFGLDSEIIAGHNVRAWGEKLSQRTYSQSNVNTKVYYANPKRLISGTFNILPSDLNKVYYMSNTSNSTQFNIFQKIGEDSKITPSELCCILPDNSDYELLGTFNIPSIPEMASQYFGIHSKAIKIDLINSQYYVTVLSIDDEYEVELNYLDIFSKDLICYLDWSKLFNKNTKYSGTNQELSLNSSACKIKITDVVDTLKFKFINYEHKIILNDSAVDYEFKVISTPEDNTLLLGTESVAYKEYQTVMGKYNAPDYNSLFVLGNGNSNNERSNAFTVDFDGNVYQQGKLTAKDIILEDEDSALSIDSLKSKLAEIKPPVIPDYNQNSESASDYIKNRPFYSIKDAKSVTETFYDSLNGDPTVDYVEREEFDSIQATLTPSKSVQQQFKEGAEITYTLELLYDLSGDGRIDSTTETGTVQKYSDELLYVGDAWLVDQSHPAYGEPWYCITYNINTNEITIYAYTIRYGAYSGANVTLSSTYVADDVKQLDTKFINTVSEISESVTNEQLPTAKAVYDYIDAKMEELKTYIAEQIQAALYVNKDDTV